MAQRDAADGWKVYRGKKKRGSNSRNRKGDAKIHDESSLRSNLSQVPGSDPVNDNIRNIIFKITKRVNECKLQFRRCIEYLVQCITSFQASTDIHCIICYGIGSFEDSFESQAQMALIVGLKEQLEMSLHCHLKCYIFDPVLTSTHYDFLEEAYGFTRININEECSRPVYEKTLFYMPHLDAHLYNNLLRSNLERLSNLLILGNSFRYIIDSSIEKQKRDQLDLVKSVSSLDSWKEFDLVHYDQDKYESSFNQIVLQGISDVTSECK